MEENQGQPVDSGEQETGQNNQPEEDLNAKFEKSEQEKAEVTRERDFYKGFNAITPKYQAAGEFQDEIKEKVMSGYEMEDAVITVLTKKGKFNTPEPIVEAPRRQSPVGGSATTTLRNNEKQLGEMSGKEIRDELVKLEYETGGLSGFFNKHLQ